MKQIYITILLFLCIVKTSTAQLTVTGGNAAAALVDTLVGTGVTVTNIVYTGNANSKGTFKCAGGCNLGSPSGVFLTSGFANTTPTTPVSNFHSDDAGTAGDAQLTALLTPPDVTLDAAVLEFDFTAATDSVQFKYVFGSEEYNEYVNLFNDAFAFFISGPGIPGGTKNIALVPGTSTPVTIDNVNNGNSGGVGTGPCTNCAYYHDNMAGGSGSIFYDGFTVVLVAGIRVMPCETYHMKFVVADVNDHIFDTGVFLQANSFSSLGQIQIYANGQAQANSDTVFVCTGDSVTLNVNQAPHYLWSNGDTTQTTVVTQANLAPGGNYSCVIINPAVACFAYTTFIKVIFVNPVATVTASGPTALCPGGSVTLTSSLANSYQWSNGATTQSINVNTAGTFTVTVTNVPSCNAVSAPVTVTIANPTAAVTGITSICSGQNTTLTATAGASYLWSTGATTQSINVNSANTYTATVTFAGGCTASGSSTVTVNPLPSTSIAGINSICQGASTTLDAGAGFTSYLWSTGATTSTINTGVAGSYTVTVTGTGGCTSTATRTVTVNPLPTPAITGTTTFCQGNNSTLNAGAGYASYAWSTGLTTQTINVTAGANYTVTVTDGNGCSKSTSTLVTVNANPVPVISGSLAFCAGNSTTLNAGAGYTNYLWSTGASTQTIAPSASSTFTVTVTNVNGCTGSTSASTVVNALPTPVITGNNSVCQGTASALNAGAGYSAYSWSTGATSATVNATVAGPYTVTVTDGNGCSKSTSFNLTVNALPTPAITGTTTFCQGGNSTLNAGAGYASYGWSTGVTTQTINVTTGSNYTVTVTDGNGCSKSTSILVTVNANPVPVISGPLAFCTGNSTTLNAGGGYTNYLWSSGATTQTITPSTSSTFTVTVTNLNGCTGSTTASTVVNPLPTPAITGNNSVCQGIASTLNAGAGYSAYSWSTGATSATINATVAGPYTVTVTDGNGCSKSTSFNLTVNPIPAPAITGIAAFCQGGNSTLNAGNGFSSYLWSTGATTQTLPVSTQSNYIVTVSNAFGCTATASQFVTVHALPTPSITGANGICTGSTATLNAGAGYSSYLWSTGATTPTISPSVANTYSVTVTNVNNCSASTSKVLTTFALPTPAITGNNVVCQGVNSSFDAGAGYSNYLWSTGATSQTIVVNTANTFSVTVTDANGCSNATARTLTVNPNPSTTISGTTAFCQGNSSILDGGVGFTSYLWAPGGATTRSINVTTGGPYTVTVSNGFNCTSSASATVTVHALPTPSISGPAGICSGGSATINAGNGYTNYLWSTGATTPTVSLTNAGSYTVTVTNVNGCTGTTNKALVIFPLPTPAITGTAAICQGTSSLLQAGTYTSYLWSTGATTPTINAGTAGQYTVTVTDANTCSKSTSFNLTVNALPTPTITGVSAFCTGASSTLNAGSGYASYLWSTGATTSTVNVTTANNYKVTVTDGNGCTAMASQPITVWALPNPVITGTAAICAGTQSTLTTGTFASYQWSTGSTASSISVSAAQVYTVTVTDAHGCVNNSAAFNLTVRALPTAAISKNSSICIGKSTTIDVQLTGTAPFHYSYTNGTTTFGPLASANAAVTLPVAPVATTTYTLTQVNDAYCTGTFSGSAKVIVNPLPTPAITGLDEICDGETATLQAGNYSGYVWSTGEITSSITVDESGNYKVTVTDVNGCVNLTSHLFTVNETPVIAFTNDTSLTCEAPIIHFTNLSSYPAGSVFQWDFADGANTAEENPAHQFSQPGNFPISLTITSQKGCTATTVNNLDIIFYPLPVARFNADLKYTSMFDSQVNLVDQSENAVTWQWNLGDGNMDSVPDVKHYYPEPGKYQIALKVTNIAGCVSEIKDEIFIAPFFIPSAFTPNNDGKNELFFEPGFDLDVQSFNMRVFNRWGQMVFATDSYKNGWNGYDTKGKAAPAGVYTYILKVVTHTGKDFKYTGDVTLLR